MTAKPVELRPAAIADVEEAVDHYLREAGTQVALEFVAAVEAAYLHIGRSPSAGSPRYAVELGLPGLRAWRIRRFPHLVFYIDREGPPDVWRVLHGERDIPRWLGAPPAADVLAGDDDS